MLYTKTCIGCGQEFQAKDFRKQRCKPHCRKRVSESRNKVRSASRNTHDIQFIAVDGEGIDTHRWVEELQDTEYGYAEEVLVRRKAHNYVLLSVGDQSLHNGGKILTHEDIFPFLYEQFQSNPESAFVGFFLGYDFAQWFKSLPASKAWMLLHKDGIARRTPTNSENPFPWPVRCDGWEFDILANKRFKLRPAVPRAEWTETVVAHKDGTFSTKRSHPHKWMYICDAGSFFQTSLLTAIDPSGWEQPVVTDAEYEILVEGKNNRDTAQFGPEMIRYNILENDVLARLMREVNLGFVSDEIRLPRNKWFGPGQAAQLWMRNIGVPTGEEVRTAVPEYARIAARESYYGGWFSIYRHGIVPGTTYGYDVNSAYPYAIASLPCLLHGEWTHGEGTPPRKHPKALRLVDARIRGSDVWDGGMPHRRMDGTILRPRNTSGWYWDHEVQESINAGLIDTVEVDYWVDYRPCPCPPPLRDVSELYEGRLKVGKNSPFGKSKKLVYNSSYGKLAQSVGNPRFANPFYASLITSRCRTMILNAIATHPEKSEAVVMVATDGIVFRTPHPNLDIHPTRLGAWDADTHENLSLLMPGLYWDDVSRARVAEGKAPKLKSRGVPARDLAAFMGSFDDQWAEFTANGDLDSDGEWPYAIIPIAFHMTSAKLAAAQNRWEDCGRVSHTNVRRLESVPFSKRSQVFRWEDGTLRSTPYEDVPGESRSTPYERAFGEDGSSMSWQDAAAAEGITPDGTVSDSIRAIIP